MSDAVVVHPMQPEGGRDFSSKQRRCRRHLHRASLHKRTRQRIIFFASAIEIPARYVAIGRFGGSV